jgi:kumamolisin
LASRSLGRIPAGLAILLLTGSLVVWAQPDGLGAVQAEPALPDAGSARPADPGAVVDFRADLVIPGLDEIAGAAAAISNPANPEYRHFLSAEEFGARFGLPADNVTQVVDWFVSRGFRVIEQPANRSELGLRGTAGELRAAFGVRLQNRIDAHGVSYHTPIQAAVVPPELRSLVRSIGGLDTSPALRPQPRFGPATGLRPADLAKAYGIDALRSQGLDGAGQSVAVVSFDTFDPQDIAAFDRTTGISGPPIQAVRLPGAGRSPGDGQDEVSLDLETVRAIAPKAQIYDYEAPQSASWSDIINRIVEDHKAQIVSISWGRCEPVVQPEVGDPDDIAFASAEMSGLSIFVSSGDSGAYDCIDEGDGTQRNFQVAADYPAVSPHVIAVGGTYLSIHQDGAYLRETAWQDPLGQTGSGGGLSGVFPRPLWQVGPGVNNQASTGKRQLPDVSGPADPASGLFVVSDGQGEVVGGTSAATPFWAGSMALAAELASNDGLKGLGFVAPVLYAVGAAHQADGSAFHDVTVGANLYYPATVGWDFATGWGSPELDALVPAIVQYLRDHSD